MAIAYLPAPPSLPPVPIEKQAPRSWPEKTLPKPKWHLTPPVPSKRTIPKSSSTKTMPAQWPAPKAIQTPVSLLPSAFPSAQTLTWPKRFCAGWLTLKTKKTAQDGIGGKLIQVTIADDSNDANVATRIATAFADDPQILVVVGHNASDASLAAAPIYEERKLVMISPSSSANRLTNFGVRNRRCGM